jgi:hypothetical protein
VKETRIFAAPVEVREQAEGTATIAGYGAVFGNEYEVAGFTESVSPRAFAKTLKEHDGLAVVWSHDPARVLGTEDSGTARFSTDERGLKYEADLDLADPDGMSAYRKIATGKVRQSSFSFEVVRDKWEERDDALPHRTLTEVRLWETSPVLWGANPAADVDVKRAVRSLAGELHLESDAETIDELLKTREASTEPPADAPPAEAPVATAPPEAPSVPRAIIVKGLNG